MYHCLGTILWNYCPSLFSIAINLIAGYTIYMTILPSAKSTQLHTFIIPRNTKMLSIGLIHVHVSHWHAKWIHTQQVCSVCTCSQFALLEGKWSPSCTCTILGNKNNFWTSHRSSYGNSFKSLTVLNHLVWNLLPNTYINFKSHIIMWSI